MASDLSSIFGQDIMILEYNWFHKQLQNLPFFPTGSSEVTKWPINLDWEPGEGAPSGDWEINQVKEACREAGLHWG